MNTEGGSASAGPLSAYLGELEPDAAAALGAIVARAQALVPALTQGTSYGMPALVHRGKPLLSIIQRATHLAYYPHSGRVVTAVADDLAGFSLSKGTVRFSVEKPLPAGVVDRLILARRDEIDRGYRGRVPLVVRPAVPADAAALAVVAAATFPLACPPHTTDEAKADFIATNLTETSFSGYLDDPDRALFIAELDGETVGYTMLVFGEPHDEDVAAAIRWRPTVELSKVYVLPGQHGAGVGAALMAASLDEGRARGAVGIWLGVNQENARANRFYEKSGFAQVGSKKFLVGERWEDDFVRELAL